MTVSRYKDHITLFNNDKGYKKAFATKYKEREELKHLETSELLYPSFEDITNFQYANHIWALGDRYYKLSHAYYGSAKYWWVIAWFNKKPTEQHVSAGDLIKIPMPLDDILNSYGL